MKSTNLVVYSQTAKEQKDEVGSVDWGDDNDTRFEDSGPEVTEKEDSYEVEAGPPPRNNNKISKPRETSSSHNLKGYVF